MSWEKGRTYREVFREAYERDGYVKWRVKTRAHGYVEGELNGEPKKFMYVGEWYEVLD